MRSNFGNILITIVLCLLMPVLIPFILLTSTFIIILGGHKDPLEIPREDNV